MLLASSQQHPSSISISFPNPSTVPTHRHHGMTMTSAADPTVVLVPIWGVGHFAPMIEAGKRLLARSSRPLTLTVLIIPAPSEKRASEIADHVRDVETESAALNLPIRFHHLPSADDPPAMSTYSGPEEFISLNMQPYVPHVRSAVAGLPCPVAAVVVDLFCTPLLDAAHGLGVPAYVYLICSAAMCALLLRSPALDDEATAAGGGGDVVEFEDMDGGVVRVPGLPPVPASSLPSELVDRKLPTYRWFLYNGRRYTEAAGIIVNTVAELEPRVLAAIADGRCTLGSRPAPPVYTVGPVLAATITTPPPADARQQQEEEHECVRWLDSQPAASVVFLCFGSARFFTARQAHEAAHALDRSGHRFLWVLRGPPEHGTRLSSDGDLGELLPPGFTERTKGRGLVWPKWAPQKEILAHAAVGGFVTHCGWNSVLESLCSGVPMLLWPSAAEQHYNAFTLKVAGMGVAVAMEVRRKEDSFVEAAELERAVRALMGGAEGRTAREKAREMKAACRSAVEEGGSSYASLQRLCDAIHQGAVIPRMSPQESSTIES